MIPPKIHCPTCQARLAPARLPAKVQCPRCMTRIILAQDGRIEDFKAPESSMASIRSAKSGAETLVPLARETMDAPMPRGVFESITAHPPAPPGAGVAPADGKAWYKWGAPILVANQKFDGSWHEAFSGVTDTCFALLFLKRYNVAQDVTRILLMNPLASPK